MSWIYREQFNNISPPFVVGQTWDPGGDFTCYNTSNKGYAETILDATTSDPQRSLHIRYNSGEEDSSDIVECYAAIPIGTTEMWASWRFKYSSNWLIHPVYDKMIYFKNDANVPMFTIGVRVPSSIGYTVIARGGNSTLGTPYLSPNRGTPIAIEKDIWYKATLWIKFSSPGLYNGEFKVWVNDILQMEYDNQITLNSSATRMAVFALSPVWGGNSDIVAPNNMDKYFDDVIWSDSPLYDPSVDTTPPYTDQFSPVENATGVLKSNRTISFHIKDI
jgi:hypothetical protein